MRSEAPAMKDVTVGCKQIRRQQANQWVTRVTDASSRPPGLLSMRVTTTRRSSFARCVYIPGGRECSVHFCLCTPNDFAYLPRRYQDLIESDRGFPQGPGQHERSRDCALSGVRGSSTHGRYRAGASVLLRRALFAWIAAYVFFFCGRRQIVRLDSEK